MTVSIAATVQCPKCDSQDTESVSDNHCVGPRLVNGNLRTYQTICRCTTCQQHFIVQHLSNIGPLLVTVSLAHQIRIISKKTANRLQAGQEEFKKF